MKSRRSERERHAAKGGGLLRPPLQCFGSVVVLVEIVPRAMVVVAVVVGRLVAPLILVIAMMAPRPAVVVEMDSEHGGIGLVAMGCLPAFAIAVADRMGGRTDGRHDQCTGTDKNCHSTCGQKAFKPFHGVSPVKGVALDWTHAISGPKPRLSQP